MGGRFALVAPVVLLALSNVVMNYAWYANLKGPQRGLVVTILLAWLIALGEYVFMIPANRIGIGIYSLAELKTIATVLSLAGFVIVAYFYFGQKPGWNQVLGFALMALGSFFVFRAPAP